MFVDQTRPLYEWSRQQDPQCRFYVNAHDLTGDDKALYVSRLQAVEATFYKRILRR
jgi:hypothetical protein